MMTKKVDMIVDLQYGSTGKGAIAGYLAVKNEYDLVVNANMPNAGHTFIDSQGNIMMHKVLPNGIVSPQCKTALIGPGSIFSINQLRKEIKKAQSFGYLSGVRILIHHTAVVLTNEHKSVEQDSDLAKKIGSTAQGTLGAITHKLIRDPESDPTAGSHQAREELGTVEQVRVVSNADYNSEIYRASKILAEGAQGFSLGINERFYPYCTSRDCSVSRFLSDMAIPVSYLNKVIGTARTYPIRVGGNSGRCYADQREISWADVGVEEERTTVTNRVRRVFTFSATQVKEAMYMMEPDEVFLNFCNYIKEDTELNKIQSAFNDKIRYTGWGPTIWDIKEI